MEGETRKETEIRKIKELNVKCFYLETLRSVCVCVCGVFLYLCGPTIDGLLLSSGHFGILHKLYYYILG